MGQIFKLDVIKTLIRLSTTTVQMPSANFVTVGGQQYRNASAITVNLATTGANGLDTGALTANKLYAVHAVVSGGALAFVASLYSNTLPSGFSASKIVGYFDTNNSSQVLTASSDSGHGKLGDVKHSILTEAQFQAENGPGWILADARSITGSRLNVLQGFTTALEARGRVLRGKDNGAGVNPDGDLSIQATQADNFGSHYHHGAPGYNDSGFFGLDNMSAGNRWSDWGNSIPSPYSYRTETIGGNETRMKNVTTNIFVKVN